MLSFTFARITNQDAEILCMGFTAANGPAKVGSAIKEGDYELMWTFLCDCCGRVRMCKAAVKVEQGDMKPGTVFAPPPLPDGWHKSGGWILCGFTDSVHSLWAHD